MINGLIGGLKESVGRIHGEILVMLKQAYEERLIETMIRIHNDPERIGATAVKVCRVI